ncbi:MAG TPA: peptide deformylase [Actinomycetota bacterium]|nr:peptide deformylase [Actinomycetota bacterium]
MATLPIRLYGDPVLRTRAQELDEVDRPARRLMKNMTDTMREAPGIGLAAPQVGVLKRIIVWENGDDRGSLANPVILEREGAVTSEEGCLSMPGITYPVERAQLILVEGLDEDGEPVRFETQDLTARIIQHEVDHLNGVLFIDHLPSDLRKEAIRTLRELAENGWVQEAAR